MKHINLPYYKKNLVLTIEEEKINAVLAPKTDNYIINKSEYEIVKQSLENPINSPKLSKLSENKKNILIVTSDHTRPMPSHITMPMILKEIRKGNPKANITILIGTGLHREMSKSEMINRFGEKIYEHEKIVVHNAYKSDDMVEIGYLPSGSKFSLNKLAYEADLLVCEGFIEPHFFAGFSGGRKSILPGISSDITVNINHSSKAIAHPFAKTGKLDGNPIHEDMIYAAKKIGVNFILNVIMNSHKRIIKSYCGEVNDAHLRGCSFLKELCGVKPVKSDIVITTNGGYPLDQNLYQCPKGISTAAECVNENGVIIMVASCFDGIGGEKFGELMKMGKPREILDYINNTSPEKTISEQWCVQIMANYLLKYTIILVSEYIDHLQVSKMNIISVSNINEALETAYKIKGIDASITIIPDGVSVIVSE